mgnify:CR=1 FL=1
MTKIAEMRRYIERTGVKYSLASPYNVVRQIVAKGNSEIKRKKREGKDSTKEETAQKEQRDSEMGEK